MTSTLTQGPKCAKRTAAARVGSAADARDIAEEVEKYFELAWLGERLATIERFRLESASALIRLHGEDPRGERVRSVLGLSEQAAREQARLADVLRRVRRTGGEAPPGKSLEERKKYVAVQIALAFIARLGARVRTSKSGLGAGEASEVESYHDGLESHPRASERKVRVLDGSRRQCIEAELSALERREFGPGESEKNLPDDVSGATRRNRRRAAQARAQFEEQRQSERLQRLQREADRVGGRLHNPAGIKPLPLHEGRKARKVAFDREEALRFLRTQPHEIRVRLFEAATRGGSRGRFSHEALLVYAFYAYILWQAEAPRPVMRRHGFDRAVEGLCREALAVAFVWNAYHQAPYHANTISALARSLEEVGLLGREAPNSEKDAYTGTTGWALYVYRLRNAEQLADLLKRLGEQAVPEDVPAKGLRLAGDAAS